MQYSRFPLCETCSALFDIVLKCNDLLQGPKASFFCTYWEIGQRQPQYLLQGSVEYTHCFQKCLSNEMVLIAQSIALIELHIGQSIKQFPAFGTQLARICCPRKTNNV